MAEDSGQAKKAKAEVETKTETTEPVNSTAVSSAAVSSTVALSEPLAKFFGTGEAEMTDKEIIRRVWEYIKLNNLEVRILSKVLVGLEILWFLLYCFPKVFCLLLTKACFVGLLYKIIYSIGFHIAVSYRAF